MAKDAPTQVATVDEQASSEVAILQDKQLLERFADMAVMIPAEDGGGTESILRQLLSAQTWADLNEPWESTDIDDIIGKHLRLESVVRRPSTFAGGLGQFLIVKCSDQKTGKKYVKTTGSISVVGAFAWLYATGTTAVLFEWCKAARPTEQGFYPQHIRIIDAHTPERPGA